MSRLILDPFGGPGGWAEGLRMLGLSEVGVELDASACATRAAAGHRTIRADVCTMPLDHLAGRVEGLIMSPPCQAFSMAGKRQGWDALNAICRAIAEGDWSLRCPGSEVLQVGRWAETIRPRWIACEQVPTVNPIWLAYVVRWRDWCDGWTMWNGVLNAADYGVPQTRQRAFLVARTDGPPVHPPAPTHSDTGHASMFGELRPWVSMDDAIGWGFTDKPARTICGHRQPRWIYQDRDGTHGRVLDRRTNSKTAGGGMAPTVPVPTDRPAPTLTGQCLGQWLVRDGDDSRTLTTQEVLTLQGFPADYPVQGNRSEVGLQVANAVPPLLAAHVIASLTGRRLEAAS